MPDLLIVEDEAAIADALLYALREDGHSIHWVTLARDALAHLAGHRVDLVILDVGLPDGNGFEVCKTLRRTSDLPVLFLTARASEIDRIVGLEIGADDYVVKPFSPREVAARVRAILKRTRPAAADAGATVASVTPAFEVDESQLKIRFHGTALQLTPHEYRLLACLIARPRQVHTRDQLLAAIGVSTDAGYARNIDTHVKELRAKLKTIAADSDPIRTHRGFGYSYQPAD